MRRHSTCFPFLAFILLIPFPVFADWVANGIPIATSPGQQNEVQIASDGAGGVIAVWLENGNLQRDIYAQRVDADGNILWAVNGVPVCACTGSQVAPQIVSDGTGGAFVAWENNPNGAADNDVIYLGRISGAGQVLWNSTPVGGGGLNEWDMMADGNHGVVITWATGGPLYAQILAQRFNGDGQPQWPSAILCNAAYDLDQDRNNPVLTPDGAGGFLVNWSDFRRSYWDYDTRPAQFYGFVDLYMQRIDPSGARLPFTNGYLVQENMANGPSAPGLASGAAIAFGVGPWLNRNLRVQRITSNGDPVWLSDIRVNAPLNDWFYQDIVADGADGFLVVWAEGANGQRDPYAQRVGPDGGLLWNSSVPFLSGPTDDYVKDLIPDGTGGFVAVVGQGPCCGISRLQRVNGAGEMPWGPAGVPLSNAEWFYDHSLVLDGAGGVYCAWSDNRDGNWSIYLQRFDLDDGSWGSPVAVAISSFAGRADAGRVTLTATFRSDLAVENVTVYRGAGDGSLQIRERVIPKEKNRFVYIDENVTSGMSYRYQIGIVDPDGEFVSPVEKVTIPALGMSLEQNHPNPFNPSTTIRFSLPSRQLATLAVYDSQGRLVRTLVDGIAPAGMSSIAWNGRDEKGMTVTSGVYFYRLASGKFSETKKMTLLK